MAGGARPLRPALWAGGAAAAALLALTLGTVAAVLWRAGGRGAWPGPADWSAVRFTLAQAALSAAISTALAVPVARALARRRFRGRGAILALLGAPFILPTIVAVLGLLAVYGRSGWISDILRGFGLGPVSIYGLGGVVLAHVFFNLPLAVRLILQGWLDIPAERFRLAASLGMGAAEVARFLERPMLRAVAPGVAVTVFLICLTSFAVALILGGGPRATTVELAIYQAFRFDFDPGRAAVLAVLQFAVCVAAAVLAARMTVPSGFGAGLDRTAERWDSRGRVARAGDAALIGVTALFLAMPLAAIVAAGLPHLAGLPASVWAAAARSVVMALASAGLTLALALALGLGGLGRGPRLFEAAGMLTLAASPLVMGTGLFLVLQPLADPAALALPVTVVVNAAMALPFALRAILPGLRESEATFGRLADSLGLHGFARLRLVTLPRMRRPLGFASGLAAALAMGDLGVVALFADPDRATLPLQVFRLMGAYRMEQAAAAALLLLALSLSLFWIFDRGGRLHADT